MKITKFGHCCMLIEENGKRILTDPGKYTDKQNTVYDIDIILITHEHSDHFHIDSLKMVLNNNPNVKVITNKNVGELLKKEGINFGILEDGKSAFEKGVLIEGIGKNHAIFHSSILPIQNTGFFIANRLFYPGDAFINPKKSVEILALPVSGPWMKISEAIDFALELNPKICFPVHEALLKSPLTTYFFPEKILIPNGIKFEVFEENKTYEF